MLCTDLVRLLPGVPDGVFLGQLIDEIDTGGCGSAAAHVPGARAAAGRRPEPCGSKWDIPSLGSLKERKIFNIPVKLIHVNLVKYFTTLYFKSFEIYSRPYRICGNAGRVLVNSTAATTTVVVTNTIRASPPPLATVASRLNDLLRRLLLLPSLEAPGPGKLEPRGSRGRGCALPVGLTGRQINGQEASRVGDSVTFKHL